MKRAIEVYTDVKTHAEELRHDLTITILPRSTLDIDSHLTRMKSKEIFQNSPHSIAEMAL